MDHVVTQSKDGICRIQILRPEKKNALTGAMYRGLATALDEANAAADVRVVLLHGAPGVFTAGNDLQDFLAHPSIQGGTPQSAFMRALRGVVKPVIAAVEGPAVGIGTTMLLHCDLVYAAPNARFHLPFVDLALVPEFGSSLLLPALAGHQRAAQMLLLAEPFDAALAREIGLVAEVVEGDVLAHALGKAEKLCAKPAGALRASKALLLRSRAAQVDEAIAAEAAEFSRCLQSPEAKEALTAFVERRKPDFSRF